MENLLTHKALDRFNEYLTATYNLNTGKISEWPESAQIGLMVEFMFLNSSDESIPNMYFLETEHDRQKRFIKYFNVEINKE